MCVCVCVGVFVRVCMSVCVCVCVCVCLTQNGTKIARFLTQEPNTVHRRASAATEIYRCACSGFIQHLKGLQLSFN